MKQKYIDSAIEHFKKTGPKFTTDGDLIQYYKVYRTEFTFDTKNGDVTSAEIRIGFSKGNCFHRDYAILKSQNHDDEIVWSANYNAWHEKSPYFFRVQSYDIKKLEFVLRDPTALGSSVYIVIGMGLLGLLLPMKALIAAGVGYCIYKTVKK